MDVNVYASDPRHAPSLIGNHENTEIGNFLRDYLDLDLEPITEELKAKGAMFGPYGEDGLQTSWLGNLPAGKKALDEVDHYQGDFKRNLECGHLH